MVKADKYFKGKFTISYLCIYFNSVAHITFR